MNCPTGFRNPVIWARMVVSPRVMLASSQMTPPAGAATATARASTNTVRSSRERTTTCPTRGRRKGGNSRAKAEGVPFSTVAVSSRVHPRVAATPSSSTPSRAAAPTRLPPCPTRNRVMRASRVGNFPLHGTRDEVSMAARRSRGLSMIRHPVTPQAVHPRLMHMVRACFPQALAF